MYYFGDAPAIELDIAVTFPIHIHVKLDALARGLVYIYLREAEGNGSEVDFGELETGKWTGERRSENGFDDVFGHLSASHCNVWPQLLDEVI